MPEPAVLAAREGGVATLTLNRPQALNALDRDLTLALRENVLAAEHDPAVRCLVLRGGEHFMAGGDLKWFSTLVEGRSSGENRVQFEALIHEVHTVILALRRMPKPVLASVRGAVAGFGMSLMMACDLALAADSAYFTLAYTLIGVSPDGGSTFSLPRIVGQKKAMEIALLGERFDAATAERLGLVNRVVPCRITRDRNEQTRQPASPAARPRYMADESAPQRFAQREPRVAAPARGRGVRAERLGAGLPRRPGGLHREAQAAVASLKGKTLFITGASRGIGLAIALRAARDGANVVIAAKTTEPHPKLPGTIYTAARGDRGGGRQGAACVVRHPRRGAGRTRPSSRRWRRFGGIDILVNNASAISLTGTLDTPMKRFDLMHGVNVRGTFAASQACIPHLLKAAQPAHPEPLAAAQHRAAAGSSTTSPTRWRSTA